MHRARIQQFFTPFSLCASVRLLLPFAFERRFQLAGEHLGWIYPCSVRNFPEQRIWLAFFFFFKEKMTAGTRSRSRSVSAVSGSRAEAARLVASIRPPSLRAVSGGVSSECPAPQPSPSPSSTLTSAFRGDRQTGGRTVCQSISQSVTDGRAGRWRDGGWRMRCLCVSVRQQGQPEEETVR